MDDKYFEGILQLRNPNSIVIDFIEKTVSKKDKVAINKIKKVRGGVDFYLTSNKYLIKLGRELQKMFGGILKTSSKLYTRNKQTSKEVHRVNVLLRLMDFKKDDIVKIDDKIIKIKHLGKKIKGIDLITNKNKIIEYNEDTEVIEKFQTIVSKIRPQIEVIHPSTFQSIKPMNEKKLQTGQKVKVVLVKNRLYLT